MKRIALINQRYGIEVNGGSEYYTRLLAEQLEQKFEVEVLTTTALSYDIWENYYEAGQDVVDGIAVRRFKVEGTRNIYVQRLVGKLLKSLNIQSRWLNYSWVNAQGPYAPELIRYISTHKDDYDIFIFVTYLYYPTVYGMSKVKDKAIFIPTAHDEYYIYFKIYEELFHMPKGIIFLTDEEKAFVHRLFHNEHVPYIVAGVGIDVPEDVDADRFRQNYAIKGNYLIYTGRVDENKGCGQMFKAFREYRTRYSSSLELVVLGQAFMDIPQDEEIHYLGFVSEKDKFDAVAGAEALWLPSEFESLSISVLEAMALGRPVLVNGKCEVLRGHCIKSKGGFYYENLPQAIEYLAWFAQKDKYKQEYEAMCAGAGEYAKEYYSWNKIMEKITDLIEKV